MNARTKRMLPAMLIALAGAVEIIVALTTLDQFAATLGIGLVVAAITLAMQARKA